jgi:phage I-like protein
MAPRAPTTKPTHARAERVERFRVGDLEAEKRETWIQVAKTGEWFRDGRKVSLTTADLESMVAKFAARKNDLVLDYEHATENPLAAKAPAAGWVKELEVRENGTQLWARVKFTKTAAEHVREDEYRFTSPAFVKVAENRETGERGGAELCSVGLVNEPFLDGMAQVALARRELMAEGEMDPIVAKLLEITGAADPEALVAAVEAKFKAFKASEESMKDKPADEEAVAKMKRDLQSRDDQIVLLSARLAAADSTSAETADQLADRAVTEAIKAKHATESEREVLKRLYVNDRPAFEKMTKRAVVPSPQVKGAETKPDPKAGDAGEVPPLFVESMKATGVTDPKAVAAAWAKNGPKGRKTEV